MAVSKYDYSQTIQGDLRIFCGGLAVVAMGCHKTKSAHCGESFLPSGTFAEWEVLSANKEVVLEESKALEFFELSSSKFYRYQIHAY